MNKSLKKIKDLCKILGDKVSPIENHKEAEPRIVERPLFGSMFKILNAEIESHIDERHLESEISRIDGPS